MEKENNLREFELRDEKAPYPKTREELNKYLDYLLNRTDHSYGSSVYTMSLASVATFNYVSSKLGVSGFQASCADLDIIRRTRTLESGFRLIDYNDLLYPQNINSENFPTAEDLIEENKKILAKKARELLAKNNDDDFLSPKVKEHWEYIASLHDGSDDEDNE